MAAMEKYKQFLDKLSEKGIVFKETGTSGYPAVEVTANLQDAEWGHGDDALFCVDFYYSSISVRNAPFAKIHDIKTHPHISTHAGFKKCPIDIADYRNRYPHLYAMGDKRDTHNYLYDGLAGAVLEEIANWAYESQKDIAAKVRKVALAKFKNSMKD